MPMLMLIPRLAPFTAALDHVWSPPPPPPGTAADAAPDAASLWFRLSGSPGAFAMIGLGDIVLPALAVAYGRRVDLCRAAASRMRGRGGAGGGGYFAWAVRGDAITLK